MTNPVKLLLNALLRIANSAKATVLTFLLLIVVSAVLYSQFESRGVGDSIWWAVVTASTVVTSKHSLGGWLFPRLVMALLDTPDHMTN